MENGNYEFKAVSMTEIEGYYIIYNWGDSDFLLSGLYCS